MNDSDHLSGQAARYWERLADGRVRCLLCPHHCRLADGQRGRCFVRACSDGKLILTTYGRSSGFCVDPIEKKPLNHFLPGSAILSFGTAGCNLRCTFCQNWSISTARHMETLADEASPQTIAEAAKRMDCRSVAFTYNEPVIFLEYAVDIAEECRRLGIRTVAVTAGYICAEPRKEFFAHMDAANVDLKAFTDRFYKDLCGGDLQTVLDTLLYLKRETEVWVELTTLLIPGENDSREEIAEMTRWVVTELGADVPMHFTAFHPAHKCLDHQPTSLKVLRMARETALENGVHHVYLGNVADDEGSSTYCVSCHRKIIGRYGYSITDWGLDKEGKCSSCGTPCPGVFESEPGEWGSARRPVRLRGM